ncbi:hypothetical protein N7535_008486 [Penicillium sp. DV-2018c]|nr:hypothetical protein N7461_002245 [Penicillium sp. DV-2018c]KAJ5563322.1 hypothetical protein N7535_008486 [Penicillium sp. DV-2018c]
MGRSQPIGEQWLVQLVRVAGEHPEFQARIQAGLLWFVGALLFLKLAYHVVRREHEMSARPGGTNSGGSAASGSRASSASRASRASSGSSATTTA